MPDHADDPGLIADSLELLSAFRTIDNPGLRRTIISLAQALQPASYGAIFYARRRPRQPPGPSHH